MPLTPKTVMALGIVFVPFITGFMARIWGGLNGRGIIFTVEFNVGGDLCGLVYSISHYHRMVHGNATNVGFQM